MNQKKLDPNSIYNKYDINKDGTVSDQEILLNKEFLELDLREEKAESQKKMAWAAMIAMIIGTIILFTPIVTQNRVNALSDLLGLFYISQAGIVGAYMGVTAWMSKK